MYSKGILLKAKIYIVLVSKFEKTTTLNKQQERALGHLCLGKMISPTGFGKYLIFQRCGNLPGSRERYSKC